MSSKEPDCTCRSRGGELSKLVCRLGLPRGTLCYRAACTIISGACSSHGSLLAPSSTGSSTGFHWACPVPQPDPAPYVCSATIMGHLISFSSCSCVDLCRRGCELDPLCELQFRAPGLVWPFRKYFCIKGFKILSLDDECWVSG